MNVSVDGAIGIHVTAFEGLDRPGPSDWSLGAAVAS